VVETPRANLVEGMKLPGSVSEHHQGRERSETEEQKAKAIISARLTKLGREKK
jgi:hypothetical protein